MTPFLYLLYSTSQRKTFLFVIAISSAFSLFSLVKCSGKTTFFSVTSCLLFTKLLYYSVACGEKICSACIFILEHQGIFLLYIPTKNKAPPFLFRAFYNPRNKDYIYIYIFFSELFVQQHKCDRGFSSV